MSILLCANDLESGAVMHRFWDFLLSCVELWFRVLIGQLVFGLVAGLVCLGLFGVILLVTGLVG